MQHTWTICAYSCYLCNVPSFSITLHSRFPPCDFIPFSKIVKGFTLIRMSFNREKVTVKVATYLEFLKPSGLSFYSKGYFSANQNRMDLKNRTFNTPQLLVSWFFDVDKKIVIFLTVIGFCSKFASIIAID